MEPASLFPGVRTVQDSLSSVTQWIEGIKDGDDSAAAKIWERYYQRLIMLILQKLRGMPRRVADEEDVVLSAFASLYQRAQAQKFPDLRDRNDLWYLIVCIAERKVYNLMRAERREKRDHRKVIGESALAKADESNSRIGLDVLPGLEPTPEFAAATAESVQRLFAMLPDDESREIAQRKMEGYTNEEIAVQIDRSVPTVERRLKRIRNIWKSELPDGFAAKSR
jgi:RNA polymerase sigma factor (sigma-70 family)